MMNRFIARGERAFAWDFRFEPVENLLELRFRFGGGDGVIKRARFFVEAQPCALHDSHSRFEG